MNLTQKINNTSNYDQLVKNFNINPILNNTLIDYLNFEAEIFLEDYIYNGSEYIYYNNSGLIVSEDEYYSIEDPINDPEPKELFQYFIISEENAKVLSQLSDELIYYIPDMDLFIWAIDFFGVSWDSVPFTFKSYLN